MSAEHDSTSAAHDSTHAAPHSAELVGPQSEAPDALPLPTISRLLADPAIGGRGNGPVRQAALLQLQRTQGNRAVQRWLQGTLQTIAPLPTVQRTPRIDTIPQGRGRAPLYRLHPGSWQVDWASIHARVATIADLVLFTNAFSVANLRQGSRVSRRVTLPSGNIVTVDLDTQRGAGREGNTRRVGPGHVSVVFNRGADLEVALGLPPLASIPPEAVANANAHRDHLQRNLDNHVFEVFVHELSHALLLLERDVPASAAHSTTFNNAQALRSASERGAAAVARRQVAVALILLIQDMAAPNPTTSADPQVLATLQADPQLTPAYVLQWLLDERITRTASDRAAGSHMDNAELATSYVERLRQTLRAKIQNITHQAAGAGATSALTAHVREWLDQTEANLLSPAPAP